MSDISQIDRNFLVQTELKKEDIAFYDVMEAPFCVYGVFYENGMFRRLPEAVARTVNDGVYRLHTNTAGGRVRFRTNSPYVAIHAKMPSIGKMAHFALTGSAGFDLYVRDVEERYIKTFVPPFTIEDGYESVIDFEDESMREITINFPLYSAVSTLYIGLSNRASVCAPDPYQYEKPVVYYGSSITQGGCASRPGNSYESIISRRFHTDYVNLGFSGSGRGEETIAQYIKSMDMSVFVYDYDHNAPTVDHLRNTHEKMFLTIRQENPDLPIILMGRPKFFLTDVEEKRFEIIKATYDGARARGDQNVYLLSGRELMSWAGNEGTVDNCHPNDLGFTSMAKAVGDVLEKIL